MSVAAVRNPLSDGLCYTLRLLSTDTRLMKNLLHSGKFWLKTACFGTLAAALAAGGLYAALYHIFSEERIRSFASAAAGKGGRSIRYGGNIGRSLLPRPTLTLNDVVLTQPHSNAPAVYIKQTQIGLSWRNFFSDATEIEKWVVRNADAALTLRPDGTWNLQDMMSAGGGVRINRLIVENSTFGIQTAYGQYRLHNAGINVRAQASDGRPFEAAAEVRSDKMPSVQARASGRLLARNGIWQLPRLHLDALAQAGGHKLAVAADADLNRGGTRTDARNLRLRVDSDYHNLHLSAQSPSVFWETGRLNVNRFRSTFTAGSDESRWDGTLSLDQTVLGAGTATVGNFELNTGNKTGTQQSSATLAGSLLWTRDKGLRSDNIRLATLQEKPGTAPTRFAGLFEGKFDYRQSVLQAQLSGLFDRQPAAVNLKYSGGGAPKLEAGIALQKLSLAPYWSDLQNRSGSLYPAWLREDGIPETAVQFEIGSLDTPLLQLDNFKTLLAADRSGIRFSDFSAGLYGGTAVGSITVANSSPPRYRFRQTVTGVEMRPFLQDLFGYHRISGSGNAFIDLAAQGVSRAELTRSLNGTFRLNVADGAWIGIDMNRILQSGGNTAVTAAAGGSPPQTPFRSFVLDAAIDKGISRHSGTELQSDSLRIVSSGHTDLAAQTLSEDLLVYNARNKAAKPVPLKISGAAENPSVTIDFQRLTSGLTTRAEKQKALADTLRGQWQWLNGRQ